MDNLLSNAIKFSPSNTKVVISTQIVGDHVRVFIRDQGKEIPKEFRGKVFDEFARAEMGTARTTSGTGIGLSLCKRIIELSGGKINFSTEEGGGTTFYFALPYLR